MFCRVYAKQLTVIPIPSFIQEKKGTFQISRFTKIYANSQESLWVAEELAKHLWTDTSSHVYIMRGGVIRKNSIIFKRVTGLPKEGYYLFVRKDRVILEASTTTGFFYGVQTIRQLLPPVAVKFVKTVRNLSIPSLIIKDSPRPEWPDS